MFPTKSQDTGIGTLQPAAEEAPDAIHPSLDSGNRCPRRRSRPAGSGAGPLRRQYAHREPVRRRQVRCLTKLKSCLLTCHGKALKAGTAVDPTCVAKCRDKFDLAPAVPEKGCFAKLEAKGGCGVSVGDSATLAAKVDAHVRDAVAQLTPAGGTPSNKCTASKIRLPPQVRHLRPHLVRKAAAAGRPIADLSKCQHYLAIDATELLQQARGQVLSRSGALGAGVPHLQRRDREASPTGRCLRRRPDHRLRDRAERHRQPTLQRRHVGAVHERARRRRRLRRPTRHLRVLSSARIARTSRPASRSASPTQWNGAITGTFDQATGASAGVAAAISRAYNGISLESPCPRCVGDLFPNDGSPAGTCSGGSRNGLRVRRQRRLVRADLRDDEPGLPAGGTIVATFALDLSNSTDTMTKTVTASSPICNGAAGKKCLCATCSLNSSIGCDHDADCAAVAGRYLHEQCRRASEAECVRRRHVDAGQLRRCACRPAVAKVIARPGPASSEPLRHRDVPQLPRAGATVRSTATTCVDDAQAVLPGYDGNVGDTVTATGNRAVLRNSAATLGLATVYCVAASESPICKLGQRLPRPGPHAARRHRRG